MSDTKQMGAPIKRTSRANETRESKARRTPWKPPSTLEAPPAPDGFKHRWIRAEMRGYSDQKNISAKLREGWELVRKDEYPNFEFPVIDSGQYEGVFGTGGLILARMPVETIAERNAYFAQRTVDQDTAIESSLLQENAHPSMKFNNPERQSRVTFGGGASG